MSDQITTPAAPASTPAPAPKKRKNYAALKAVLTLAVFVLGCVIGASGTHSTTTNVTPAACITALDSAESIMHASGDAFGAVSKAFDAVSRFDAAGVQAQLAPVEADNAKVTAATPGYNAAATDCRAH